MAPAWTVSVYGLTYARCLLIPVLVSDLYSAPQPLLASICPTRQCSLTCMQQGTWLMRPV